VAKIVDLTRDPREERQASEPNNVWLRFKTTPMMTEFLASTRKFPNVPVGAPDDYAPPASAKP
jgi:hypothetical protein